MLSKNAVSPSTPNLGVKDPTKPEPNVVPRREHAQKPKHPSAAAASASIRERGARPSEPEVGLTRPHRALAVVQELEDTNPGGVPEDAKERRFDLVGRTSVVQERLTPSFLRTPQRS